jgi:hypothetical protein
LEALEKMLRVPDFIPVERGVKVTVAVQEAPGASVAQLLVWKKVPALAEKREIEVTLKFPPPVLLMATVRVAVWRTFTIPQSNGTGETRIIGPRTRNPGRVKLFGPFGRARG